MKRIIILDRSDAKTYRVAFWAEVPPILQREYARRASASEYEGITEEEQALITSGAVVEEVREIQADNLAKARQDLLATWTVFQDKVSNVQKRSTYGTYFDSESMSWKAEGEK